MNGRLRSVFSICGIAGILICMSLLTLHVPTALAQNPVPTPTYDPFAQPELPSSPTELEMGRYLFWRHCMPCHGDAGQGLTAEFRLLWEDHQNCWDRGCHGGKKDDEGFPISTTIPAIVTEDHLMQFASEEELFEYLKATHPPQYPGFLEDEEYHDIAFVLFKMNSRSPEESISVSTSSPAPTPTFAPTFTPAATQQSVDSISDTSLPINGPGIAMIVAITFWALQKFRRKSR